MSDPPGILPHSESRASAGADLVALQRRVANGEAALLLLESILIGLVEQGRVERSEVLDYIHGAIIVDADEESDDGKNSEAGKRASGVLTRLANSVMSIRREDNVRRD